MLLQGEEMKAQWLSLKVGGVLIFYLLFPCESGVNVLKPVPTPDLSGSGKSPISFELLT